MIFVLILIVKIILIISVITIAMIWNITRKLQIEGRVKEYNLYTWDCKTKSCSIQFDDGRCIRFDSVFPITIEIGKNYRITYNGYFEILSVIEIKE